MKKTKLLAVLTCAALAFTYFSCSNSSGSPSGNPDASNEESSGIKPVSYTVLPEGTDGSAGPSDNETIKYVTFGTWPQSLKADDVDIDTESGTSIVNGWEVYTGSDDEYYVRVDKEDRSHNMVTSYYKVEPIKWRILNPGAGGNEKEMLLAENILKQCAYFDYNLDRTIDGVPISANNYEHSRVRAFLNGLSYQKEAGSSAADGYNTEFYGKGFLYTAFTAEERAAIADTSVVNNARSANPDANENQFDEGDNQYFSDTPTSDKIFLLSEQEVTKADYGFAAYNVCETSPRGMRTKRLRLTTDYVNDMGPEVNRTGGQYASGGYAEHWWLRSPMCIDGGKNANYVFSTGRTSYNPNNIVTCSFGVVPALCLK